MRNSRPTVNIQFATSPAVAIHLRGLIGTGLYGRNISEAVERLVAGSLTQMLKGKPAIQIPYETLAKAADLSVHTIRRLEVGDPATPDVTARLERALKEPRRRAAPSKPTERYSSVFVSYGGPDHEIASRLARWLRREGVDVYFFPKSATPGRRLHRELSDSLHAYDRILLLCSRSSLIRPGVLYELEQVLAREVREGGAELLIPVTLDAYLFRGWRPARPDLARQLRDRVVADFTRPPAEHRIPFRRLLRALRAPQRKGGAG